MLLLMILTLIPFILLLFPRLSDNALDIAPPLKADPYHLWNPLGLVQEGANADLVQIHILMTLQQHSVVLLSSLAQLAFNNLSNTICTLLSVLTTRTLWGINAMSMICSSLMTFARSCRRKRQPRCKHCPKAIRSVQAWKRVCNGSVVTVHDAFTSRSFQDSSLIFVTDYHPLSKTLAEQHLGAGQQRFQGRHNVQHIPEQILWGYMTQIANALKAIHSNGLAARVIDASKILLTGKNRIRLNACAIMDVVQFDSQRTVADLQRQDLVNFGQLIVTLGANSPTVMHNPTKAMEHFTRAYSPQLKNSVFWLLNGMQKDQDRNIDVFITGISSQLMSTFDSALHLDDQLTSDLSRELENGRLVRLMAKLNFVNERPEYEHDRQWSENGERYFLKIFRDYVFHQVDAQGDPVVDLGHVITCLNKLDAGTEEKITLISRDEQSCFIVSYKELKKALESSFQALMKPARRMH
ncbi:PAN-complex poly(A)-binding subunit PAN3 [Aspergillus fumigatus Af293]|uniref:Poly(A)-binding protein-dependent poly(A) ribonuclease, putative n=1 Tax=Aspergillus fumigatus (strain CBS 144.89 / FGSC A1163 / CEA10) TaxID=451804 RepID=B0XMR1_ASPFC|nr:poly(A)-binding protein-dependent poly(A) ribonuclease, putative [Aspergillus fumigatus Af293]EAL90763.1 poly(A)-binding protein-dependent poly(A) ribonuclease, putative [Aspergillus fumigatus Af293]EDP56668.1 poly(A)-binding protein-dependent poly(A) ribonuclease, putative [Aspergillus fumigatus A1163]KEY79639.1 polyA binding protein dependent polyA ribonuclease [Aspergillus fumigatus]